MSVTERQALRKAIVQDPKNSLPRLVYADWLDETRTGADAKKAELIRLQCRLDEMRVNWDEKIDPGERSTIFNRLHELTNRYPDLAAIKTSLWNAICLSEQWSKPWPMAPAGHFGSIAYNGVIRRGFLERVEMKLSDWVKYGPGLVADHPITEVDPTGILSGPTPVNPFAPFYWQLITDPGSYVMDDWLSTNSLPYYLFTPPYHEQLRPYSWHGLWHGQVWFKNYNVASQWCSDLLVDYAREKAELPTLGPSVQPVESPRPPTTPVGRSGPGGSPRRSRAI